MTLAVVAQFVLERAHAQIELHRAPGDLLGVGHADQQPRVAGRQFARAHEVLHRRRQLQQPQRVGDMRPALADDLRDLVLASS